jgi:parallel beta-helix repeat protein
MINVMDYGATGDGSTDDTAAFHSAISVLASTGGTLYVPPGVYIISTDYSSSSDCVRPCSNMTLQLDSGATLKASPSVSASLPAYAVIYILDVTDVTICGGAVMGDVSTHTGTTGEQGGCVELWHSQRITIRDVALSDAWGDGIYVTGEPTFTSGTESTDIAISGVRTTNCRRNGMAIVGARRMEITNSSFNTTGATKGTLPKAGIDCEPDPSAYSVEDISITNCSFDSNSNIGVQIAAGATRVAVSACTFHDNAVNAILFGNTAAQGTSCIIGNTILSNTAVGAAICLDDFQGAVVANNTISGKFKYGISMLGGASSANGNNVVANNYITGDDTTDSQYGIYSDNSDSRDQITGNWLSGVQTGIWVQVSSNVTIANNYAYNAGQYGLYISTNDNVKVVNNTVDGSGITGIYFTTNTRSVCSGNSSSLSQQYGLKIAANTDCRVEHNIVHSNSQETNNTYANIQLASTNTSVALNYNTVRAGTQTNKPNYGIQLATQVTCQMLGNDAASGGATYDILDAGAAGNTRTPWYPMGTSDAGDANTTLTEYSSNVVMYRTALTANRTVTMPASNVYRGWRFRIVRTDGAAFTLSVGGIVTIPAATKAVVDLEYDGATWQVTDYHLIASSSNVLTGMLNLGASPGTTNAINIDSSSFNSAVGGINLVNGSGSGRLVMSTGNLRLETTDGTTSLKLGCNTQANWEIRNTSSGTAKFASVQSVAQIIGGATSLSMRNNADSADNLLISDAGVATIRSGLTVTTGGVTVTAGGLTVTAGTVALTGSLVMGSNTASTQDLIMNVAAGTNRQILGETGGVLRWQVALGNNTAETGSNAGSDFVLRCYDDSGATLIDPITITRATGTVKLGGLLQFAAAVSQVVPGATSFAIRNSANSADNIGVTDAGAVTIRSSLNLPAGGITIGSNSAGTEQLTFNVAANTNRQIISQTAGVLRWQIAPGNSTAETGSNAGSDFVIRCYDDTGATLLDPITITRATGAIKIGALIQFATAASQILPGATSLAMRNSANSANNLLINDNGDATFRTQLTVTTGFACNSKAPQTAYASGGSVATTASTTTSPYGYTTQAQADGIVTLLNNIRTALVNNGIMS